MHNNRQPEFPQTVFVIVLLVSFAIIAPVASANLQHGEPFHLVAPPLTYEGMIYSEAVVQNPDGATAYLLPSTGAEVLLSLELETGLVIVGRTENADWFGVRMRTGVAGWVMADAVTVMQDTATLPVTDRTTMDYRFAIVGDAGNGDVISELIANMIDDWGVEFLMTTGDMNYPDGTAETIDVNVGQYFHNLIHPYIGDCGTGAPFNRMFLALGNHDYYTPDATPHIDYFALPGNERYYDFRRGSVHFFVVDSNIENPDGATVDSVQGVWLRESLQNSTAPFKIVFFHHSPFSSGTRGSKERMQWPFHEWGATLVVTAHDHNYQRIERPEGTYMVNGAGSGNLSPIETPVEGTVASTDFENGAVLVDVRADAVRMRFFTVDGEVIDDFTHTAG